MHFQASTPGWIEALLLMPDYAVVKGFDAGLLKDAKLKWTAAGRDPAKLHTVLRHHDLETIPRTATWEQAVAWWLGMFPRFIDGTFYEQFARFVDFVQGCNEFTATSTWQEPAAKAWAIRNEEAMVHVWNNVYRGKNGISDKCAVTLLSGPVSNDIPREIFQLAVREDCPIAYHAYTRYFRGQRFEHDWRDDSGRWHFHEQAYGVRPRWLFGECGPYINAENGWRHPDVLGGDVGKLAQAMRVWWQDCAGTPAYREGRIIGPGCWFTSGGIGWTQYQLNAPELVVLARTAAEVWHPGEYDMDEELKEAIRLHAQAILDLLAEPAWLYQVRVKVATLNVRSGPGVTNPDIGDVHAGDVLGIYAELNGWGRIDPAAERWINVGAAYVERL